MILEKSMTDDEKWLAFYYFWKLQYESRWLFINNREKIHKKMKELRKLDEEINCCELKNSLDTWQEPEPDIFVKYALPIFPCDEKKAECIKCKQSPIIIKKINFLKKYSNIENNLKKYSYLNEQLIHDSTAFLYNIAILRTQDNTVKLY